MSAENFYYKVKPKNDVRVKAIASIDLPFFKNSAEGEYNAGVSIPGNGLPVMVEKNGIPFSEGTSNNLELGPFQFSNSSLHSAPAWKNFGFKTPEDQFLYRYGQSYNGKAAKIPQKDATDSEVCFQTIYCEWDRNKFANFVIESLVGKALTQAIAYNYFGYPIQNASRRIDLNYDNQQNTGWGFGRMPDFGTSASPMDFIPEDNLMMNAGSAGGFLSLKESNGSIINSLAGQNPLEIGNGLNQELFQEKTNDDVYSRFYKMLGAARKSNTVFVKSDEFNQLYTHSHIFEIRDFPATTNSILFAGSNTFETSADLYQNGYPEVNYAEGKYEDYESGLCPDSNYLFYKKQVEKGNVQQISDGYLSSVEDVLKAEEFPINANNKFKNPFQPITKTQARLWYPSFQTSMTTSPLGITMGASAGLKTTEWYLDMVPLNPDGTVQDGADGNGTVAAQDLFDANFKTSNLVSMYKLVPAGIADEDKQLYLDKPHYTLNHILPKVLQYVTQIVPQNPRFAGPKPASQEPDTKTTKNYVSWIESAIVSANVSSTEQPDVQEEDAGNFYKGCSPLQVHRVMSGSFFEFQVGRKWQNAPLLARDPRPEIVSQNSGELVQNPHYEKLGAQEKNSTIEPIYVGNHVPHKQIATKSPPQDNIDYATKFGLWNNDWIGGNSIKYWDKSGTHQEYDQIYGSKDFTTWYNRKPGGFMLLPRNSLTIESMIKSLPSQGSLGRMTVADASKNEVNSFEMTKLVSDLWLSYHFATKPNGMGFLDAPFYTDAIRSTVPEWKPFSNLEFKLNTKYNEDGKISSIILTSPGIEGISNFSYFDDVRPSLFNNSSEKYSKMLERFAGTPTIMVSDYSADFYKKFDYTDINYHRGIDVPIKVNRVSQLEFPIWAWKRGGGQGYSDLNDINWAPMIQDPAGETAAPYSGQAFNGWTKYIEQNPKLLSQVRECVPRWVNSLKIYPTVKQDAIENGFVPPDLEASEETIKFSSSWDLDGSGKSNSLPEQYNDESNIFIDKFWDFSENAPSIYSKQQAYLNKFTGAKLSELHYLKSYKETGYLPNACHPWMTLNYEIDHNLQSENYKKATDKISVTLSYAVELGIDENQLVLDLVRQGIVGLAGEIEDYVGLGIDLDTLFEFANGSSSLYTEGLINGFNAYSKTNNPQKYEGANVNFGAFPSIASGQDVSVEAQKQALEALPRINEQIEKAKEKYPSEKYPITSYVWLKDLSLKTPVYSKASASSRKLGYVNNFTTLRVLKEWVNGKGDFNKVIIIDSDSELNETEGFIAPELIEPAIDNIFFATGIANTGKGIFDKGSLILNLQPTEISPMSEMARAVVPTWWKESVPYYHRGDGEFWVNVELYGEDCVVDDSDLEAKKELAVKVGLKQLFDFYNKDYNDTQLDKFSKAYLATSIDEYLLSLRPGSSIRFLLKVGGIYFNALPNKARNLEKLRADSTYKITLNEKFYQTHLTQALYGLNRLYLDLFGSDYSLQNINFIKEIERLENVPIILKQIMALNLVNLTANTENTIEVGFDDGFKVTYFAYKDQSSGKERLMDIGFDYFSSRNPISNPNTMSLFFHHRELRNPMLKWRDAVEKYFINPKAIIVKNPGRANKSIPSSTCAPSYGLPGWRDILGPIAKSLDAQLQLDPRFDLGAFQFNLWRYFPPCPKPPSGVGDTLLLGEYEINNEKFFFQNAESLDAIAKAFDGQNIKEYVGDWATSAKALEDIKFKVLDMDDLMEYLRGTFGHDTGEIITFFYSKICKCFLDLAGIDTITLPNFEIDANAGAGQFNISPQDLSPYGPEYTKEKAFEGSSGPDVKATNPFTDKGKDFKAEDLFCSFCIEIPSFFLRLPTTNILDVIVDALLKLLEALLAQLILALIQALIDVLLTCPELSCPPGERNLRDYGGNDLGDIFGNQDNLGQSQSLPEFFSGCGLIIDNLTITGEDVLDLMTKISARLTSGEVLSLITDGATEEIIKVGKEEIEKYPAISQQLDNHAKIEDFFRCAGLGLPKGVIADLEDEINNKFSNPEICSDIANLAAQQLAKRCGVSELLDSSVDKALNYDIDKYKRLADAIRKNQDLSNSIPTLFGDCFGNSGVLSGLPNPAMDFAIEQTVEGIISPFRESLKKDLENLTRPVYNYASPSSNPIAVQPVLVKYSPKIEDLKRSNPFANTIELLTTPGGAVPNPYTLPFQLLLEEPTFKDIPFGSNVFINKQLKFQSLDDTVDIAEVLTDFRNNVSVIKQDSNLSPPKPPGIEVLLPGNEGEKITLNVNPVEIDENGSPVYVDNYTVEMKIKDVFGAKNLETIELNAKDNNLPPAIVNSLQNYSLDVTSDSVPQAQFFSELILDNFKKAGLNLTTSQKKELKQILENDIYWSTWESALNHMASSLENSELLQNYKLNRQDEFIGFNPIQIFPLIPSLLQSPELYLGLDDDVMDTFYGGIFIENELRNLDMRSYGDTDSIVNIKEIKETIKKNYDFSKWSDPRSETMGMPHYAILSGLLKAFIQVFVGEIYIRGIIPVSKFPIELLTTEEYTVELIYRSIKSYFEQSSPETASVFIKVIKDLFKPCNSQSILFKPDNEDDPEPGIPGTATGLEKDYRIESWEDGLKFMIRLELQAPVAYIKNKLSSFKTKNGTSIVPSNPISAITYSKILQVPDEAFTEEKDNVSLFQEGLIDEFKNGKIFMQFYYEVVDWDPEDQKYNPAVAQRDSRLKGILSEDNFVELISKLCGIPPSYPDDYDQVDPILVKTTDGTIDADPLVTPFKDLFKEINFGFRFCYGAIQTTQKVSDLQGSFTEEPLIKDQNPKIPEFINKIKDIVGFKDGTFVYPDDEIGLPKHDVPTTSELNLLQFSKTTKSLLLIEEYTEIVGISLGSAGGVVPDTVNYSVKDPLYTVVLPLLEQKVQIAGPKAFAGGWPLLNKNTPDLNYNSEQISLFMNGSGYGGSVVNKLTTDLGTNPIYEALFRYAFPLPKIASILTAHSIVVATKDQNVAKAFDRSKQSIKDLIIKTTKFVGKDKYKIPLL